MSHPGLKQGLHGPLITICCPVGVLQGWGACLLSESRKAYQLQGDSDFQHLVLNLYLNSDFASPI